MPDATPHSVKRVLYYSARQSLAVEFSRAMAEVAEYRSRRGAAGPVVCCGPIAFEFVVEHDVGSAGAVSSQSAVPDPGSCAHTGSVAQLLRAHA